MDCSIHVLSSAIAATPPIGSNAPKVRPVPALIAACLARDDSFRVVPNFMRGMAHSRLGGLSDYFPEATNGVIYLGYNAEGQFQIAHFTNVIVERPQRIALNRYLNDEVDVDVDPFSEPVFTPQIITTRAEDMFS